MLGTDTNYNTGMPRVTTLRLTTLLNCHHLPDLRRWGRCIYNIKQIDACQCMSAVEPCLTASNGTNTAVNGTNSVDDGTNATVGGTISTAVTSNFIDGGSVEVIGPNARCDVVLDDVWLHIFSYLPLESLLIAENVCERWKKLVDVHLKGRHELTIEYSRQNIYCPSDVLRVLNRCGLSLRQLTIRDGNKYHKLVNFGKMIGDCCPNLVNLSILGETLVDDGLGYLALHCKKMQYLDVLTDRKFSIWDLESLLILMKQLKRLRIHCPYWCEGDDCFNHIGPMVEDLEMNNICYRPGSILNPRSLFLGLSSKLKNLQKLSLHFDYHVDDLILDGFAEACANLKELSIAKAKINNELLIEISRMPRLEKLDLSYNIKVDHHSVEFLVHCCPDLKAISIVGYPDPRIPKSGVQLIVNHCQQLLELDIIHHNKVDQSIMDIGCINLFGGSAKRLSVRRCKSIEDSGHIDVVTRYPPLELMDIHGNCCHLNDAIIVPSSVAVKKRFDERRLQLTFAGSKVNNVRWWITNQFRLILEY